MRHEQVAEAPQGVERTAEYVASKGEYHDNFADASARVALSRTAQPRLFDRLDWLAPLHAAAFADRPLCLLRIAQPIGEMWLALVQERRGTLRSLSNWYSFSWSPLFHRLGDPAFRLPLLRAAAAALRSRAHAVTLSPLAEADAGDLETAFRAEGWRVRVAPCDENHILRLEGRSFDDYWAARPGKLRSTVKRKGKSGAVTLRILTRFDAAAWADYQTVYARSWKPEEGSPDFLRNIARIEGANGALRLGLAYIDGICVAAQFWTCEHGRALIHKLAYDERHAKASAGTLLTHALFRHVIDEDKVDLVDYGTGSDAYKRDWMEAVRPRFRLVAIRPGHPANWPGMARAALARVVRRADNV